MYQMNTFETGGVNKNVSAATWVIELFQLELFYDFKTNDEG